MLYFFLGGTSMYLACSFLFQQSWFKNFVNDRIWVHFQKFKEFKSISISDTSKSSEKNTWVANLAYQTIYYFSYVQLFLSKKYDYIKNRPAMKALLGRFQTLLDGLKHVNRVIKVKLSDSKQAPDSDSNPSSYDFIIYQNKRDEKINHIVHFNKKKHEENEDTVYMDPSFLPYEYCNFKFILLCMIFDEKEKYDIMLTQPYNYYIIGNVINSYVLLHLLKTQYNVSKRKDCKFTLEFYDHEMNTNMITNEQEIVFEKDGYKIRKFK